MPVLTDELPSFFAVFCNHRLVPGRALAANLLLEDNQDFLLVSQRSRALRVLGAAFCCRGPSP
jgi:hypothetical protein